MLRGGLFRIHCCQHTGQDPATLFPIFLRNEKTRVIDRPIFRRHLVGYQTQRHRPAVEWGQANEIKIKSSDQRILIRFRRWFQVKFCKFVGNKRINGATVPAFATRGTLGELGGTKAQCLAYSAPSLIH